MTTSHVINGVRFESQTDYYEWGEVADDGRLVHHSRPLWTLYYVDGAPMAFNDYKRRLRKELLTQDGRRNGHPKQSEEVIVG